MGRVFRVEYDVCDEVQSTDLIGPNDMTPDKFRKLCASLVPQAARAAVKIQSEVAGLRVRYADVADQLIEMLRSNGFTRAGLDDIPVFALFGDVVTEDKSDFDDTSSLLDLGDAAEEVLAHNRAQDRT